MPFRFEETKTPKGSPLLVIYATGHIAQEDAEQLAARVAPGAANHRWLLLTLTEKGVEYASGARKVFPGMKTHYSALATVVTSPIIRAAINMMIRLTGQAPNFRLFSDQAEALTWLDSH